MLLAHKLASLFPLILYGNFLMKHHMQVLVVARFDDVIGHVLKDMALTLWLV